MMKIVDTNKYTISTYDIDFSINLLRQIEAVVEKHKFNPKDLSFTLSQRINPIQEIFGFLKLNFPLLNNILTSYITSI